MLNINRNYIIHVNMKTSSVKLERQMIFRNTDIGIANMYIRLNQDGLTGVFGNLPIEEAKNITVELALIKPKSYEFISLIAKVVSEENYIYEVKLPNNCTDLIGKYDCEIRVYATVNNEEMNFTTEPFYYTVKPSIATNLNEQIEVSSDLPILEYLIKDVKELSLGIESDSVQMKTDENLVGDNKTIVGTINQLLLKIKELDSLDFDNIDLSNFLKDEEVSTESTWSSNKISKEIEILKEDINYKPITINSFTSNLNKYVYELGTDTINSITFSWNLSSTPKSITLTDCNNVSNSISFVVYTGKVNNTKTFTLKVTDEKNNSASKSITVNFVNPFYYGVYDDSLNESIITSQNKLVQTKSNKTIKLTYTDKKVFFATPKIYGEIKDIKDNNGFSYTKEFTRNEIIIKGVLYYVYTLEDKASATDISFTFSY